MQRHKISKSAYIRLLESKHIRIVGQVSYNESSEHECLDCGRKWMTKPKTIVIRNSGCRSCSRKKNTSVVTKQKGLEYEKLCKQLGLKLLEEYKTALVPIKHKCLECRTVWSIRPNDIKNKCENRCPVCAVRNIFRKTSKRKDVQIGRKHFVVQGYEPQALEYIVKTKHIKPQEIYAGDDKRIPVIPYSNAKRKRYYPDMYIPSKNIIVEVKSDYTVGITNRKIFQVVREKALATIAQGFKYKLLMFARVNSGVELMRTPKNWTNMSFEEFRLRLSKLNPDYSP